MTSENEITRSVMAIFESPQYFPVDGEDLPSTMPTRYLITVSLALSFLIGCGPAPPEKFVVAVNRATTHIVEPRDEAGYIDYLEAANARHSNGISPENNWQVVLRRVFGPLDWDEASDVAYYQRLGIPRLAPNSREGFVVPLSPKKGEGSELEETRHEQFYEAMEGPWRTNDYPEFAAWLAEHDEFWERLVEGSHVSGNYIPLVMTPAGHAARAREFNGSFSGFAKSADDAERAAAAIVKSMFGEVSTVAAPLSRWHAADIMQESRHVARIFLARANLRIAEGDLEGAKSDLFTIHRVARISSQGMLSQWLIGRALEGLACVGDAAVLQSGRLSKAECRAYLADLNRLGPLPPASHQIDVECRHAGLDALQYAARQNRDAFEAARQAGTNRETLTAFAQIDWNEAMRSFNAKCDKLATASKETHPVVRLRMTAEATPKPKADNNVELAKAMQAAVDASQDMTTFMADLCLSHHVINATKAELRSEAYLIVVRAAFAADLYRFDNGSYPERIEAIVPILGEEPIDPFCGLPVRLTTIDGDFVIYSVGQNQEDDDGLWHDDEPSKDDVRVRLPTAKR